MNTWGFFPTCAGRGINEEVKKKKKQKHNNKDKRKREDNELGDLFNNFRTSHVRSVHKSPRLARACDILYCQ